MGSFRYCGNFNSIKIVLFLICFYIWQFNVPNNKGWGYVDSK